MEHLLSKFHQSKYLLKSWGKGLSVPQSLPRACRRDKISGSYWDYFTSRWLVLYGYVLMVFIVTPYLPVLIRRASSTWSSGTVSSFVLGVEISIGVLLMVTAGAVFFFNRRNFLRFVLIMGGLIGVSYLFYSIIPNPYELTHLPEYAVMGVLVLQAIRELEGKRREKGSQKNIYFRSAVITGLIGSIDELYQGVLPVRAFTWYDIVLNGLGGILGLAIVWGISRK